MDADEFIAQDSASSILQTETDDLANSLLNFATSPEELELLCAKRHKTSRDPMSHRIIEKRRRDRMNNCLADLSRLIPTSYLKQGQGRIEKTEIIEMAIKHIKTLQAQVDGNQSHSFAATNNAQELNPETTKKEEGACCNGRFYQGFKECQDETLRYFVEEEAISVSEPFCLRVMDHLSGLAHRVDPSYVLARSTHDRHMDMENQVPVSSASTFRSSSPMNCQSGQDSPLPLPPLSGRLMVPGGAAGDKHLRNLLKARALQQLEGEREMATPGNAAVKGGSGETSRQSPAPPGTGASSSQGNSSQLSSPRPQANSVNMDSGPEPGGQYCGSVVSEGVSSGYMSDISAVDRLSGVSSFGTGSSDIILTNKEGSALNIYKFKHNITKRFSQEGKSVPSIPYDGSSSASSREADEDRHNHGSGKHRTLKNKCRHPSSIDSGPYPKSEFSGATSTSSHESGEGSYDKGKHRKLGSHPQSSAKSLECSPRPALPLPGFLLHPSGTHYMPMSVCHSTLPDIFEAGSDSSLGPPVFHPISIPVLFRGPVISLPGPSTSALVEAIKNGDTEAQHKEVKGLKKTDVL